MSALSNIVINDGKATPLTHTFYPIASSPVAQLREQDANNPLVGQGSIQISVTADKGSGLNKVRVTLSMPSVETVGSAGSSAGYVAAPKVAYTTKADLTFLLPSRSTAIQRKDVRVLLANLLANASIIDAVENVVAPY